MTIWRTSDKISSLYRQKGGLTKRHFKYSHKSDFFKFSVFRRKLWKHVVEERRCILTKMIVGSLMTCVANQGCWKTDTHVISMNIAHLPR